MSFLIPIFVLFYFRLNWFICTYGFSFINPPRSWWFLTSNYWFYWMVGSILISDWRIAVSCHLFDDLLWSFPVGRSQPNQRHFTFYFLFAMLGYLKFLQIIYTYNPQCMSVFLFMIITFKLGSVMYQHQDDYLTQLVTGFQNKKMSQSLKSLK